MVNTAWFLECKIFITTGTRALVMPLERSIDIDTYKDWAFAELALGKLVSEKMIDLCER